MNHYLTIAESARTLRCKPWPVMQAVEKGPLGTLADDNRDDMTA